MSEVAEILEQQAFALVLEGDCNASIGVLAGLKQYGTLHNASSCLIERSRPMPRPTINPGTLIWSGEHWINYLRRPGEDRDSGMVSLYHTRYSVGGEGTVAFVDIPGDSGFGGICTDNREVADFILNTMIRGKRTPSDRELPIVDANITRDGDIRTAPSWVIETARDRIVATWTRIQSPVIAEGWAPTFREDLDFFTLLFFTDGASILLNGRNVDGQPYLRDVWKKSIGGDRSSCVFALAETMIQAAQKKRD